MGNSFPEIQVTRARRRSIAMKFDTDGVLQVRAPRCMLGFQIQSFLDKNTEWIKKHYRKFLQQQQDKKYYLFGESLLQTFPSGEKRVAMYTSEAKKYIISRCNELAEKYDFSHKGIRITSAQTRWGSCSSKKTLNFSYRLVMAPKECIDYVIIHELCHLSEMNHSQKFWSQVAAIMPEYKKYEAHLKEFGWRYRI